MLLEQNVHRGEGQLRDGGDVRLDAVHQQLRMILLAYPNEEQTAFIVDEECPIVGEHMRSFKNVFRGFALGFALLRLPFSLHNRYFASFISPIFTLYVPLLHFAKLHEQHINEPQHHRQLGSRHNAQTQFVVRIGDG